MTLPRFIPKVVFQVTAHILLALVFAGAFELCRHEQPPYVWLTALGRPVAWVLTFGLATVVWLVLIAPIRIFSTMPTFKEELAHADVSSFSALFSKEKRQVESDQRRDNIRWHYRATAVSVVLTAILSCMTWLVWFTEGVLSLGLAAYAACTAALAMWHLGQVFLRLARPRVERRG